MKALVVDESRFGSTARVAQEIARGPGADLEVTCGLMAEVPVPSHG